MRKLLLLIVTLILGAFVAGGVWLLYTPAGLRFALRSVSRIAPVRVYAGTATGRLANTFVVKNMQIRLPEITISIETLSCSWQPAKLFFGTVAVHDLTARDIAIEDRRPEPKKPISLKWPRAGGMVAGMEGWVRDLTIEGVRYRRADTTLPIDTLRGSLFWHHGIISVSRLAIESPSVSATGIVEAGFLAPLLKVDLDVGLHPGVTEGAGGARRALLKGDLRQARAPEMLAGPVSLRAVMAPEEELDLAGQVGLRENGFHMRDLKITHSSFAGSLTGSAEVLAGAEEPSGRLDIVIHDVHPRKGVYAATVVAGEVHAAGVPDDYRGTFRLANAGKVWQAAQVAGDFNGSREALRLKVADGRWLGGNVAGDVQVAWGKVTRIVAALSGRRLDPSLLSRDWTGKINVDASLHLGRTATQGLEGTVQASFPASILRGRPLTGKLDARINNGIYRLARLDLHGNGFDIRASGVVQKRLDFNVQVVDLAGLIPETGGSLFTSGWLRWQNRELAGSVSGKGSGITARGATVGKVSFTARSGNGKGQMGVDVQGEGIAYERVRLDAARIIGSGTKEHHAIEIDLRMGKQNAHLAFNGGLTDETWSGTIIRLYGSDGLAPWKMEAPAGLQASRDRFRVEPITLRSAKGETLTAGAEASFNPLRGSGTGSWKRFDLSRLTPFVKRGKIGGTTTGSVDVRWPKGGNPQLEANTLFEAVYTEPKMSLPARGKMSVRWDDKGLKAGWEAALGEKGTFTGSVKATGPAALRLPETAELSASWDGMDLALMDPWLPAPLLVRGRISGKIGGAILPGRYVRLTGTTSIAEGTAAWRPGNGMMTAAIHDGSLRFSWSGNNLQGDASLVLAKYGKVDARFSLPLPAHLPAAFLPEGPVSVAVKAEAGELGLVTALLPGLVNETRGRVILDISGSGTWKNPGVTGVVRLEDAGAYLPGAGIKLERVRAEAQLSGQSVRVVRIRAESGTGWIEASGDMGLKEWRPVRYQGTLRGENFQAVNLPDLRVSVNPTITFQGDTKTFSARGDVLIPRMAIYGERGPAVVHSSPDIVVVDAPTKKKKELPIGLDIQIRVTLGDNVLVETSGVDARLAGALDVQIKGIDDVAARGTIRTVKGGYRAYGIRLDITRGNIRFYGPVDRPSLDILAVKKSGEVTAGVEVSGSPRAPVINLYSNPAMPDTDKLSYILLGHPLSGADAGQSSQFMSTAGFFQTGTSPGFTSEARARATLSGVEPGGSQEDAIRSMVSLGRYLTPGLYVGFGHSLLTNQNQVTLRYNLSKNWEVESRLGGESGMDLFYRIDFD